MHDIYEDVANVVSDLEIGTETLETVVLNGNNPKADSYIERAIHEMKSALVELSYAEFEIDTSPGDMYGDEI